MRNEKILLNVGAGPRGNGAMLPAGLRGAEWREVRVDIDPDCQPDIIGSMLDLSQVAAASVDAVFSSHSIEHLYPNELPRAFKEFRRVLAPEGFLVVNCPDLQAAAEWIAQDKLLDTAYTSPSGLAVTPFDIVYSHRQLTGRDKPFMDHHCGFTLKALTGTLRAHGFPAVAGARGNFDLWAVGSMRQMPDAAIEQLATAVIKGVVA